MKIIDNYKHLPIGLYEQIQEISRQDDIDDLHKQVLIIAVLTGKEEEEIYSLPIEEYTELAKKSLFLTREYEGDVRVAQVYKVKGWELVPVEDYRNINTAQYIDFQTFSKAGEEKMVEILSTLLVPKGKKYNQGYDVLQLQQDLRDNLSLADALTLFAFFFVKFQSLIKTSLTYSKSEAKKIQNKQMREQMLAKVAMVEELMRSGGAGLRMLTRSAKRYETLGTRFGK